MGKLSASEIIEKLKKHRGNVSAVARSLGASRTAVYNYINDHKTVKAALEEARESMKDEAESVLYSKVLEGSTPELLFYLKTQAQDRGYIERQKFDHSMEGKLVILPPKE